MNEGEVDRPGIVWKAEEKRNFSEQERRFIQPCFGSFDDTTFDTSGLSPVQSFGKLCALAMLTTGRVGLAEEDPSMSQARPLLSVINKKGLVTADSQMGKDETIRRFRDGHAIRVRQRSYVTGIMPRHMERMFLRKMFPVDGVIIYTGKPAPAHEWKPGDEEVEEYRIPVSSYNDEYPTSVPMATEQFNDMEFLPEVQRIMSVPHCRRLVEEDAMVVNVVDTVWGRPFWLFEKIAEVLQEVNESS